MLENKGRYGRYSQRRQAALADLKRSATQVNALEIMLMLGAGLFCGSVVVMIVAGGLLRLCFDEEKLKWDASGARQWAPDQIDEMPNVFTPLGVQIWRIRRAFVKVMICGVIVTMIAGITAVILDVKLDFK